MIVQHRQGLGMPRHAIDANRLKIQHRPGVTQRGVMRVGVGGDVAGPDPL